MDVTVCPWGREGHGDCVVLVRMKHLLEAEEPVDLNEVDRLIETARERERLLRESRQMLEQRRISDLLKERIGRG